MSNTNTFDNFNNFDNLYDVDGSTYSAQPILEQETIQEIQSYFNQTIPCRDTQCDTPTQAHLFMLEQLSH